MNSIPEKITLPLIHGGTSEKGSPVSVLYPENSSLSKIYKTKPAYLAKKITDEDLFGDTLKPAVNLGLSQINEEKEERVAEADEFGPIGSDNDLDDDPKKENLNIFQKDTLVSSKYKEHGKGPAYTKTGQIVKHSIVGPAEMFERYQRNIKKHLVKDSGMSFEKDNVSMSDNSVSRTLKPLGSFAGSMDQTPTSNGRLNTSNLNAKRYNSTEKKKENRRDIRVTKEDILKRVQNLKEVQSKFYDLELKKYQTLPLGDQLHHTKEKRCLEEFDQKVIHWQKTIDNLNQLTKRSVGKPVMLTTDEFREKMELAEAFNLVQTDQERFGTTFWYMTLRKYGVDSDKAFQRVYQDIPEGFRCPQIVKPGTTLEIIRKPVKLDQTSSFLPSISQTRYLERTRDEYLNEKSSLLHSELSKIMTTNIPEMQDFMVEGKNKLELEVDAILRVNQNKDTYVLPRAFFEERETKEKEAEVIAANYEAKEIVRNGLAAFVK